MGQNAGAAGCNFTEQVGDDTLREVVGRQLIFQSQLL